MKSINREGVFYFLIIIGWWLVGLAEGQAKNFTTGSIATVYGTHEITLEGPSDLADPFTEKVEVSFSNNGVTKRTYAFYDGDGKWKIRLYIPHDGQWTWTTTSSLLVLNGKRGSFNTLNSSLPGKIRVRTNRTDILENARGEWFTMLGDTGYYLFHPKKSSFDKCKTFVTQSVAAGLNVIRANIGGNLRSRSEDGPHWYSTSDGQLSFNVNVGKNDDKCLQWMLDTYPGMYVQLIIIPEKVSTFDTMSLVNREKALRYVIGRYGAYANVFWLLRNDTNTPVNSGLNLFGADLKRMDPWDNLRATGHTRRYNDPLWNMAWTNYSHLETASDLGAKTADEAVGRKKYTWTGEDWYETYPKLMDPRLSPYFFRRLFWSYILSGSGAAYGGYWDKVGHMGKGMSDLPHIMKYFKTRKIDLGTYVYTNDKIALAPGKITNKAHVANRGSSEYIIYLPNESSGSIFEWAQTEASMQLSLLLTRTENFKIEWFNADTGQVLGQEMSISGTVNLKAPWKATDVVCRLIKI